MRQTSWFAPLLAFSLMAAPAHAGWQLESQTVPPENSGFAAFDPGRGLLYLQRSASGFYQIDVATGRSRPLPGVSAQQNFFLSRPLEYDSARNQLITVKGSVWTYSIATGLWQQDARPFPSSALAAIDLRRDRLLVWSGNDTLWTLGLSNHQWNSTQISTPPPGLTSVSIAADSAHDRMLVHAGPKSAGTTWALDLAGSYTWAQFPVQGTQPLATSNSLLFVDPVDDRLVLAGDCDDFYSSEGAAAREVSSLTLAPHIGPSWFIRRPYAPPPTRPDDAFNRTSPIMAFDRANGTLWAFGGATVYVPPDFGILYATVTSTSETLRLDLRGPGGWHSVAPFGPPTLVDQALARDPASGRAFVVGNNLVGGNNGLQTFEFMTGPTNGGGYRQLSPATTPFTGSLYRKKLLVDVGGRRLILIGSNPVTPTKMQMFTMPIDGPYVWSSVTLPTNTPPLRDGMSVVTDERTHRFIFFGGEMGGVYSNGTDVLTMDHGPEWVHVTGSAPAGRAGHVAVFDPVAERMLIFGGRNAIGMRSDTWQLDLTDTPSWSQSATVIPAGALPAIPPRADAAGIWDATHHRLFVVGGRSASATFADCWQLDVDAEVPGWTPVAGPLPSGRYASTVMHDPAAGRWWLAGGVDASNTGVNEVWSYQDALSVVGVGPGNAGRHAVALAAPRPNPARASVTLSFTAPPGAQGQLEIFDVRGRRVRTLPIAGVLGAANQIVWDGREESGRALPAGVYLCRLQAGGSSSTRRVTLLH